MRRNNIGDNLRSIGFVLAKPMFPVLLKLLPKQMNKNMILLDEELIILSKQTIDKFLKYDNASDLIALYTFYYYTAKWQKTNRPKATAEYCQKGLHWGAKRFDRTKKILKQELGLIEDIIIKNKNNSRITGWYIKINYIWKKSTVKKLNL